MHPVIGMERFFGWLFHTTWQAAVIALLILLAQFLLRNRLSPAWRHGLWFLLVARLLMPMTPPSAVSLFNLAKWPRGRAMPTAVESSAPARAELPVPAVSWRANDPRVQPAAAPQMRTEAISGPGLAVGPGRAPPTAVTLSTVNSKDWMALGAGAWFAGASVLMLRFLWLNRRFRRRLAGSAPVSDELVRQPLQECAELLGVEERVLVIETQEADSPAVYGVWRQRLLLPEGLRQGLSAEQLRHVLLHELAHIKRRDPELNGLVNVLQILHWFNPVLWFAFSRMRADREVATDDLVLAHMRQRDRASYGETIIKVLEGLTQWRVLPGLVGIGESKAQMKERFRAIARGKVGPRGRWAACAVAVLIAGVALTSARQDSQTNGSAPKAALLPAQPLVGPPQVVSITPANGATNVAPGLTEIKVVFDRPMQDHGWSFVSREENDPHHPQITGQVHYDAALTTWTAPVQLKPNWRYEFGLNDPDYRNFKSRAGVSLEPVWVKFTTGPSSNAPEQGLKPGDQTASESEVDTNLARVVSVLPADGAEEVDPVQQLRIHFDRAMDPHHLKLEWLAGGFQLNGSIEISGDQKEFTLPVRLIPGRLQTVALNYDRMRELRARSREKQPKPAGPAAAGFLDRALAPANEFRWSFETKAMAAKPDAPKPRMVSVSPASGATTPVLTMVEITFDVPMQPPEAGMPSLKKRPFDRGPSLLPSIEYDSGMHRFTLPALLTPDNDDRLTLTGFYSAEGVPCDTIVLHYQTGAENLDPGYVQQANAASKDPQLRKLLTSMKEARARFNSGLETVQTISLGLSQAGNAFNSIDAKTALFKWRGADRVYADISGPMSMGSGPSAFVLGSDGQNCWLYSQNDKGEKRLDKTSKAYTETEITLADPFGLANGSIDDALGQRALVLSSKAQLEGRSCYRIESWEVNREGFAFATKQQWWIDEGTFLPKQVVQYYPGGCEVLRFDYQELNGALPDSAFQPPVAPEAKTDPLFFTNEPKPGEQRFLRISDGSNGKMSGRIGWQDQNGRTSSGLN